MASPTLDYLRSPFENVFQILPQGHDKALKQAFYNTAATLFVVLVCCAAIAVYYILEAFLRPLLWAVLCGTFLHPFKNTLTRFVQGWLKTLRTSGTPLVVGTVLLPVRVVDQASEALGTFIFGNVKLLTAVSVGLPSVYFLYYFGPLRQIGAATHSTLLFTYHALGYFSSPAWVWTVVGAYILVVIFLWTPQSRQLLRHLAVPVWVALLFHLATIAGPLRVPILIAMVVLICVGFAAEVNEARKKSHINKDGTDIPMSPSAVAAKAVWNIWSNSNHGNNSLSDTSPDSTMTESQDSDRLQDLTTSQDSDKLQQDLTTSQDYDKLQDLAADTSKTDTPRKTQGKSSDPGPKTAAEADDSMSTSTDTVDSGTRPQRLEMQSGRQSGHKLTTPQKTRSLSEHCFIALLWAIVLVRLWKNFWVFQLLPILIACLLLKKIGAQLGSWQWLRDKASLLQQTVCKDSRFDILAPKPIRGLGKLVLRGDRKIVAGLELSMDKMMSILIILLVFMASVLMTFFMAVQVHRESMHLVSVTSNILNNSLSPELSQWLPDGKDMQETLDTMVGNAYVYGREWLTTKINSAFNGDNDSKKDMEKQVLDVWDKVYESWFARNITKTEVKVASDDDGGMPALEWTSILNAYDIVKKADFSLNIMAFFNDHIGVVMSVVESVYSVLKGNINLALNVVTAMISLLLGGGTALLNFVISFVVFVTTLFYLLASSGETYKPVEWFSSLSPAQGGSGNRFGQAVEEAIASVFMASFKMAAFYGLYTWLTHTVFCINIVFIPSALAAIFAAIPFLGTYWAALPAVIELWLVNADKWQAIMLLVCHLLPTYVVDTAIYSDIKGGHPYLTGLAIAGGMYWLGLEGAIMGPILLCCLIVAVNVYSTMLNSDASISSAPATVKHQRVSTLSGGKKVFMKREANYVTSVSTKSLE